MANAESKKREAELQRAKAERQKERLALKEKIRKLEGKPVMARSPPPKIVTKTVKKETDKSLQDLQQYLGGTHA